MPSILKMLSSTCCCCCYTPQDPENASQQTVPIKKLNNTNQTPVTKQPSAPSAPVIPAPIAIPPAPIGQKPGDVASKIKEYSSLYSNPNPRPNELTKNGETFIAGASAVENLPTAKDLGLTETELKEAKKKTTQAIEELESATPAENPEYGLPQQAKDLGITSLKLWNKMYFDNLRAEDELKKEENTHLLLNPLMHARPASYAPAAPPLAPAPPGASAPTENEYTPLMSNVLVNNRVFSQPTLPPAPPLLPIPYLEENGDEICMSYIYPSNPGYKDQK